MNYDDFEAFGANAITDKSGIEEKREHIIILSESEIIDALQLHGIPSIYHKAIVDTLVLYSSPGRINKKDSKELCSCVYISSEKENLMKIRPDRKFIKEQLIYGLIEKLNDEAILLKSTNESGAKKYEIDIIFRFRDEKAGMEVVDLDYDPEENK